MSRNSTQEPLLEFLDENVGKFFGSNEIIELSGLPRAAVYDSLKCMAKRGLVLREGESRHYRYSRSESQRDSKLGRAKPKKVVEPKKPKLKPVVLPRIVAPKSIPFEQFKNQVAIIPADVEVQYIPHGVDTRFKVLPTDKLTGGFMEEWNKLRRAK